MAQTQGYFRPVGPNLVLAGRLTANLLALALITLNSSLVWCQDTSEIVPSQSIFPSLSQYSVSEPPLLPNSVFHEEASSAAFGESPQEMQPLPTISGQPPAEAPQVFERGLFRRWLDRNTAQPSGGVRVARESWLRRPMSVTWFMGAVSGSPAISDWLSEGSGMMGSLALGWDFDDYWGTEFRLGLGSPTLHDSDRALATRAANSLANPSLWPDSRWTPYGSGRQGDLVQFGVNALYYPWGDSPWRPYFLTGVGATVVSFDDVLGNRYNTTMFTMPLGLGMKYHWTDWMALRLEGLDNIAFSNGGINTLHNFTVLGAVEIRFGGSQKSYWPWTPGRRSW